MLEVDNRNKLRELLLNTKIFAYSTFATKFILFLLVPFYTMKLSSSEFGTIELLISASSILVTLVSLGISEALFRFSFENSRSYDEILHNFYTVSFWASVIIAVFSILSIRVIDTELSILLFFISISSHYQNGLALFSKATGKTIIFGANSVLYAVFLVLSNLIFLAWFDLSVIGYLVSIVIANTASIVFLLIVGKIPVFILPTKINLNTVKMLKYSIPLVFNSLAWMIISYSDKFMLKILLSSSAVGIYAIAIKIPSLLSSVVNVMIQAWTITTIKYLDNGEETKVFYSRIFKYFLMSIVFIAFTLMSTLKYFMKYYVSFEYYSSYIYVPVLLIAACFLGLMNFFGSILSSNKDSKSIMLSSSVGAMINLIINFLLIPIFGIMGASIATAFSYFSIMLYRALITKSIIMISIQKKLSIFSISILITQAVLVSRGQDSLLLTMLLFLVLILINKITIKNLFQTLLKKGRFKEKWKQ